MLKPAGDGPHRGGDRSFGELATQLVDDAKAYARAEVDLAKAIAADKAKSVRLAAILLAAALLFAFGAFTALSVAIFVALATVMGPILGGIVAFLLIAGIAGALAWLGVRKLGAAL
ncbi:MAG TPA: phage holin family protein [Sphingomicrobium sp.]|nr:phage holin family protein [Sphingomicrobium sp.]